jgi:hypothetical protein
VVEACTAAELALLPKYPSRTLEHCAKSLLAHAGVINREGGSVSIDTGRPGNRVREAKGDAEVGENADEGQQTDPSGPQLNQKAGEHEPKPPPEPPPQTDRDLKAVKADDAATPIWLWNDSIQAGLVEDPGARGCTDEDVDSALDSFRTLLLCRVSRLEVTRSYFRHIHIEYPDLHVPERTEVRWETYTEEGKEPGDVPTLKEDTGGGPSLDECLTRRGGICTGTNPRRIKKRLLV